MPPGNMGGTRAFSAGAEPGVTIRGTSVTVTVASFPGGCRRHARASIPGRAIGRSTGRGRWCRAPRVRIRGAGLGCVTTCGDGGKDLRRGQSPQSNCIASHRREIDSVMRGERRVVESDDRDVVGNVPTGSLQHIQVVDRHEIVVADHRGRAVGLVLLQHDAPTQRRNSRAASRRREAAARSSTGPA